MSRPRVSLERGRQTRLIHPGDDRDAAAGARRAAGVAPAEERSTTYRLDEAAEEALASRESVGAFDIYARFGTRTTREAAQLVAELEGAERAVLTASGMAAVHATMVAMVPAGGRLVAADGLYGGTDGVLDEDLGARGVDVVRFDPSDPSDLRSKLDERTADFVWCEAISNPLMAVPDLAALSAVCRDARVPLGVDATFAAGMAVRPIDRGVDLVMHSATKYLNGHSDVVAGAVAGSAALVDRVYGAMTRTGGCIDPHGAWLLARGIKTLPLRWERQVQSARHLVRRFASHPAVARVYYPELEPTWETKLENPGAMFSFELADPTVALDYAFGLELCAHATSLGGLETLVSVPARSSHANLSPERRAALGIGPGLVRVSVGIEDVADLEADLLGTLDRVAAVVS